MVNRIQESTDFKEIIKNLDQKDYSKALEKMKFISKDFPNENIILKLYAVIYFNLMEWENAVDYYKKCLDFEIEKHKIHTNIGVAYFKLGKINKSIESFKKSIENNSKFALAHINLGISYLELSKIEKATEHFISALELNKNDHKAQTYLINSFNLIKPKTDQQHPLVKINYKINELSKEIKNKDIKILLKKSNNLIKSYKENLFFNETQIFRKNSVNLNCGRHFRVFNEFNAIPKYCFSCYKIQINLNTVVDLINLFLIFDEIKLKKNNTRKCIIELRNKIKGNYKGYIYCEGLSEAEKVKKIITKIIIKKNLNIEKITIKHGCSEFYKPYPKFENLNSDCDEGMKYNKKWENFEKMIDLREPVRISVDKKIWSKSVQGINLSDILIINNWISYAQITGDESYKKINNKKLENKLIEKLLESQLEFRKKEFKI